MMYRLEVENFYSIRERQVIDLTVGRKVPEEPGRLEPIHDGAIDRAPRVVAIFGANASGKSNLLRAISFVAWFVRFSFAHKAGQLLPYLKFASDKMIAESTRISVTFRGSENLLSPDFSRTCPYVYALELAPRNGSGDRVLSETLHYRPKGSARFVRLIERTAKGEVKGAPGLGLGRTRQVLHGILRPDASVFPTLAQLNNPAALSVVAAAETIQSNILLTRYESDLNSLIGVYSANPNLLEALNRDIRRIDIGVAGVEILRQNGGQVAMFRHMGLDQPIDMELESHGTQQFVRHFPVLHLTLVNGGIAVIDELDTAIHPAILPEVLRWFSDPQRNPHGAQLWMSCHSTSLLDDLLKEEVLICEKSSDGATTVYRLSDVKGIRRGDDLARRYLGGVYGGVPRIG